VPENLCHSRWDDVEMSSRRPVITISGFGRFLLLVRICRQEKSALESLADTLKCPSVSTHCRKEVTGSRY